MTLKTLGETLGALALTAALSLVAGCGGGSSNGFSDQSAAKIAADSKIAMKGLDSLRLQGSLTSNGDSISLDLSVDTKGDCTGTFTAGGGSAEVLAVAGDTWFKPDEAFWRAQAGDSADQVIAAVGDKWVVVPASQQSFDEFCNLNNVLDQMFTDTGKTYSKGKVAQVNGQDAIAVDADDPDHGPSTGYVLVDGAHYLVKLVRSKGDEPGSVTFSDFNKALDVTAPTQDNQIDLSALSG